MAHYKKGKPVFRSRAEIYKKSKWQKFREVISQFFSNLKRSFIKLANRINEKGSQKLTIMIVPHNEKKISNIQISNYIMVFFTLILTVIVITSVVAISNNQITSKGYHRLKIQNKTKAQEIDEFKRRVNNLDNVFALYKSDIVDTIKKAGTSDDSSKVYNFQKIVLPGDETNVALPKEAKTLEKLAMELEITKENISTLGRFISQYSDLLENMPSLYPLEGRARVTSTYGWRTDPVYRWQQEFHSGLDLATFAGTPIKAAGDGEVEFMGWQGGYGWCIKIKHKYGFYTKYAHMQRFNNAFTVGSRVNQGDVIGYVGTSGKSTGYHLHFEVIIGDKTVNPQPFVYMNP